MRRIILSFFAIIFFVSFGNAQDFSNKGKEFWLCFPNHIPSGAALGSLSIWITSDQASSGTVTVSNLSFSASFSIAANGIQEIQVPHSAAHISNTESGTVIQKSIKIKVNAGQPAVVAYAQQWGNARSAATLLLPTNVLGRKYRAISFTHTNTNGGGQNSRSQFQVIATNPNTQVQITPFANGVSGTPFTISLPVVGDMYQYQSTSDVTGTLIESIATGTSACSPIAVFSGNSAVTIGTSSPTCNGSSYDPLFQQCYPVTTWGKNYGFVPFGDYTNRGNPVRVMAAENNTVVSFNGVVVATLNAGGIYPSAFTSNPTLINQETLITADKPISVAQYMQTSQCSGSNNGDPDMVILNPIEQNISDITVFTSTQQNIDRQWLNVLIPTSKASSFKINGVVPTTPFVASLNIPGYSYLRHLFTPTASGSKYLSADTGFNAILYGFQGGAFESYAYSAGTNVRDFNQQLFTPSQYGIINDGNSYACLNTPFKFNVYLPESALSNSGPTAGTVVPIRYDSMRWSVTSPTNFIPNNFPVTVIGNTAYPPTFPLPNKVFIDSIRVRNGKSVAFYSLPTLYQITAPGTYTITVRGYRTNTSGDGCNSGNETDFEFTLIVPPAPTATFTHTLPGCPADSVRFTETNVQTPPSSATYLFEWDFGDPASGPANNISTVRNPVHRFSGPGTYLVKFKNITAAGCVSATTNQSVVVPPLVTATIAGTTTLCQNTPQPNITFTATPGVPPYTFTYTINGGTPQTITTAGTNTTVTLPVSTSTVGTFIYRLVNVSNVNASFCTNTITGQDATVTINPIPTATISGTTTVCQNTTTPTITFTAAGATPPYAFTYTINGGAPQVVTTSATSNTVTINAPTNAIGSFVYNLVSVKETSTSTQCSQTVIGQSATVTVQATSSATISGGANICQDGLSPTITFTGINGTAPFTFTYNVNGGATQTISSPIGSNIAQLSVPLSTTGTFVYNLLSVQNTGSITCLTPIINANTTVIINPVPTATIAGSTTVCQVAGAQTITFTGAGGTAPYTFNYTINGVVQTPIISVGNIATVTAPVTTPNTYVYAITSVRDASITNCVRNYIGAAQPTATLVVQATSSATIAGTTTVCQNNTAPLITFTATNGTRPFTFTYNINGGATQTISTTALSNSVTLPVALTNGTFTYTLLSVTNTGPISCITPITGQIATVTVNTVPTASIAGTTTVCQNSTAPVVTFSAANGLAPYTFVYTLNGGGNITLVSPTNTITVTAPTNAFGTFTYNLVSVRDASATACTQLQSGSAIVTVKRLATATIATNAATVCQNSTTLPQVTFTATGGEAPFTFNYTLNGTPLSVTTTIGNSISIPVPSTTAGTYIYNLVSVQESSSVACLNAQTGSAQVIVHPQPTASYTTAPPYCAGSTVTFNPAFGISPTGSVTSWVWNYGDGTGVQVRPNGLPFSVTYATAGVKPVTFKTISDKGCESVLYNPPLTINSKPKAGFKSPEACLADAFAQFTDTSTVVGGTIVQWSWDFGDGTPLFTGTTLAYKNPLHAYTTVGLKTATLTVTTNSGCVDTKTQSFFINGEVQSANFIPQNPPLFCSNRPVQIRENSVVNVGGLIRVDIYWDNLTAPTVFELDDFPAPNKLYTHTYPNLQVDKTYQIRYIAYSGFNGLCQKEITKTITVHASPIATFTTPQDVCLNGGTVVLNSGAASGGTAVYSGPGVSLVGGVYTFNPLAAGVTVGNTNNVLYTVTSIAGCDSALVRQVRVLAPPVVNTFTTVGSTCLNNAITFNQTSTNGSGTIVKWIYDFGDGSPILTMTTGANVTHTYTSIGPKTATLTLETGYGCRNIAFPVTFTVNPLPAPMYSFSSTACLPNASIVFTNTTPNLLNHTYDWSFELPSTAPANVSTSQNTTVTHVYTNLGPHNTSLVATNIVTGCRNTTAIMPVNTIHPAPVLQFNAVPDICLNNGTVQLTQASETSGIAGGPGVYTGPGVSLVGGVYVINPLVAGPGTHVITYTWTSTFNCPTTITRSVKVLAEAIVNTFVTVGNKCEQNSTIFRNTISTPAGVAATWIYVWGDGTPNTTVTNGNDISHTYATAGTYAASLQIITDYGCKSILKPLSVVVNPIPRPDFRYSDTACLPSAKVNFVNITPNIGDFAYQWNFDFPSTNPADLSTALLNVSHTYFTQAPHNVRLFAESGLTGCTNSIIKPITTIHPAPFANFAFNLPSVCLGTPVGVINQSTYADGGPNKWEWEWGDGALATGVSPAPHTYPNAITYDVKLKVTNSFGCVDDTTRPFTVYPFPVINAGRDSVMLEGGTIGLTATASGNDLVYQWTGNPAPLNLSSTTILQPIAAPAADINYYLQVTARGGCIKRDTVFIKVLKYPVIPNTFTPNRADGNHPYWEIKYLDSYKGCNVQVFTRTGQLVFESKGYARPWDGSRKGSKDYLPFDTYYYIIEPGNGRQPITGYVTIVK
jgi:gliding motility-associated-like protein